MAQQGSSLQNYNNELVKCIEDLKEKREEARAPPPFAFAFQPLVPIMFYLPPWPHLAAHAWQ